MQEPDPGRLHPVGVWGSITFLTTITIWFVIHDLARPRGGIIRVTLLVTLALASVATSVSLAMWRQHSQAKGQRGSSVAEDRSRRTQVGDPAATRWSARFYACAAIMVILLLARVLVRFGLGT